MTLGGDGNSALGLVGQVVSRVEFDYAVSLLTEDGCVLRIETTFTLSAALVNPADAAGHAEALVGLLHCRIEAAEASQSGALRLRFDGDRELSVEPDARYEAWTLAAPGGVHVVCTPGGGVTTWGSTGL
jgi:hypothetical protein